MKRKTLEISFILILSILFTYKNSEPTAVPNRKVNEASVKNLSLIHI